MAATWHKRFFDALRDSGNVRLACTRAGINRSTAYRARDNDPNFAKRWVECKEESADILEAEAWRRAVKGVEVPHFNRGRQMGTVKRYSDPLLMFLLRGARPDVYKSFTANDGFESKAAIIELVKRMRGERQRRKEKDEPKDL